MSIANKWGSRKLDRTPVRLTLDGSVLTETATIRVLGVDISASGSASLWLRSAGRTASSMLHLFRRIAQRSGGARTRIARQLQRNFTVVLQLIRALFEYVGFASLVFWLMPQQMPRAIL
ncbi:hypothetical protein HPB50_025024 [Hyalomma asiaticum]|uniref:Uncharacterized protein n=1 Tax=Hyalomma asiaticum TaxID=266040 RepID=A0ACB7T9F4_HYAAI|nr:hypothetical protein HPB50_025024 [Hyalomma asiaticum]